MDDSQINRLVERVEHLERQCSRLSRAGRRWQRGGLAALCGALMIAILGSGPNAPPAKKVVEAEGFVVREGGGKERVRIGTEEDGALAAITFLNDDGKQVAKLSYNRELKSSALSLMTPDDRSSTVIYMKEDGSSHLNIQKAQRVRVSIGMAGDDAGPAIYILDSVGNAVARVP